MNMSHARDNDLTYTQWLSNYCIQYQRRKPHYVHDIFTQFDSIQYSFPFKSYWKTGESRKDLREIMVKTSGTPGNTEQLYQGTHFLVM